MSKGGHKMRSDEELAAIRVSGAIVPHDGTIALCPYDDAWPGLYEAEARRIRDALGEGARVLEHVGSTSIPGMAAKNILDILVAVDDAADEASYVPALVAQGYRLHLREPDWHEHRLLKGDAPAVNMHVFTSGSPEIARMLAFRDRCRGDAEAFALYLATKQALAARMWRHVQHYADAKGEVVESILARP